MICGVYQQVEKNTMILGPYFSKKSIKRGICVCDIRMQIEGGKMKLGGETRSLGL